MNSRERLMAALSGEPPDRIPWEPLIDDYFLTSLPADFQREHFGFAIHDCISGSEGAYTYGADRLRRRSVDFARFIGADVLELHAPGLSSYVEDLTCDEISEGRKILRRWQTSAGVLTDVVHQMSEAPGFPFYGAEYRLETLEDIRVYRHIWENTHYEPDYQAFLDEEEYIGKDGMAAIDGPQSAVQLLLGEVAGVSDFYYLLSDYPKEMEALIETMHSKIREAYEIIARSPTQVVVAMEDLSSTTSSPAIFEHYSWRHLNEYADIVHAEGKTFLAHMCGLLKAMAPLIARSKLDGVESLTSPPIGDLAVAEARSYWGDDFVLVGGLNANVMLETDQDKVRAAVVDALDQAAPGLSFILSNADAMPYGATVETLQTISRVVRELGSFPLSTGGR